MDSWTFQHREEYLRQHTRGDKAIAVDAEDPVEPEDPRLPAFLPLFSARAGAGELWAIVPDLYTNVSYWRKLVWFAGDPWSDGGNRVYWWLSYNENWRRPSLIVVCAPDVTVWNTGAGHVAYIPHIGGRICAEFLEDEGCVSRGRGKRPRRRAASPRSGAEGR